MWQEARIRSRAGQGRSKAEQTKAGTGNVVGCCYNRHMKSQGRVGVV